jgi:hypothetical protein
MIFVESRKKGKKTLSKLYPNAEVIDVTSKGSEPFVKFSPFYPHGNIPVPFSENTFASSVEGIWQGLKVFEKQDIDVAKFHIKNMKGIKRTVRKFGKPLGHRKGIRGQELLDYITARRQIYLISYAWILQNKLNDLVELLKAKAEVNDVVLLDYETNLNIEDPSKPLSHAGLVKKFLEKKFPDLALKRFTQPIEVKPKRKREASDSDKVRKTSIKKKKSTLEIPFPHDHSEKDIYASYGIIMKELQNSELLLTQLIYTVKHKPEDSQEQVNNIYSKSLRKTFNQLLQELEILKQNQQLNLQEEFYDELIKLKDLRNYFAHSFFKEYAAFSEINSIVKGNNFAFERIKDSNLILQNCLKERLISFQYKPNEIQGMIEISTVNWEEIVPKI